MKLKGTTSAVISVRKANSYSDVAKSGPRGVFIMKALTGQHVGFPAGLNSLLFIQNSYNTFPFKARETVWIFHPSENRRLIRRVFSARELGFEE